MKSSSFFFGLSALAVAGAFVGNRLRHLEAPGSTNGESSIIPALSLTTALPQQTPDPAFTDIIEGDSRADLHLNGPVHTVEWMQPTEPLAEGRASEFYTRTNIVFDSLGNVELWQENNEQGRTQARTVIHRDVWNRKDYALTYDSEGRFRSRTDFLYNSAGLLAEEITYTDELRTKVTERNSTDYDSAGDVIGQRHASYRDWYKSGELARETRLDPLGDKSEQFFYDEYGATMFRAATTSDTLVLHDTLVAAPKTNIRHTHTTHDADGLITDSSYTLVDEQQRVIETGNYLYDPTALLRTATNPRTLLGYRTSERVRQYDTTGRLVAEIIEAPKECTRTDYSYNEQGNLVMSVTMRYLNRQACDARRDGAEVSRTFIQYEYDLYNNWVTRTWRKQLPEQIQAGVAATPYRIDRHTITYYQQGV